MDYSILQKSSFDELKKIAREMGLNSKRSKSEYINVIQQAFNDYEEYKTKKIDKYTRIRQLGNKGKEGTTYLVNDSNGHEFAMKTFRKSKSSTTLKDEYSLQKKAAAFGIAPRCVEYDSVSKYIVMEKMDHHLVDVMKKQKGVLTKTQQQRLLDIFSTLDEAGVFHGDSNILNYMLKNDKIYIIDFGFSKEINSKLIKKLGTESPNMRIMTLGFVIKLKEMKYPSSSWRYLKKYLTPGEIEQFQIE